MQSKNLTVYFIWDIQDYFDLLIDYHFTGSNFQEKWRNHVIKRQVSFDEQMAETRRQEDKILKGDFYLEDESK